MFEESLVRFRAMGRRQMLVRFGVLAFALAALAFWVLHQAHFFNDPKYLRLRLAFIVEDVFALSSILLMVFLMRRLTRTTPQAE